MFNTRFTRPLAAYAHAAVAGIDETDRFLKSAFRKSKYTPKSIILATTINNLELSTIKFIAL